LAKELDAYFRGSLAVEEGLAQAAPFWRSLSDADGNINSNYGYYTFRQQTPEGGTQLDWVRACFARNLDSRKAFININNISHKVESNLDFPCTVGMQFSVRKGRMNLDVASRSTDVITGLPYDMAFFSLVNELVAGLVREDTGTDIAVGYTAMRTFFTQIYDKTKGKVDQILDGEPDAGAQRMPNITLATATLRDIMEIETRRPTTETIMWVSDRAGRVYEQPA
jgi:thymidylate synthase